MGLTLKEVEARIPAAIEEAKAAARAGDQVLTERTLLRKLVLEFTRDTMKQDAEEIASSEAKRLADGRQSFRVIMATGKTITQLKETIAAIRVNLGPEGPYREISLLEETEQRLARDNALSDLMGERRSISPKDKALVDRLSPLRVGYKQEAERLATAQSRLKELLIADGRAVRPVEEIEQEILAMEERLGPNGPYAEIPTLQQTEWAVTRDNDFRVRMGQPRFIKPEDKALLDRLEQVRPSHSQELQKLANLRAEFKDAEWLLSPDASRARAAAH